MTDWSNSAFTYKTGAPCLNGGILKILSDGLKDDDWKFAVAELDKGADADKKNTRYKHLCATVLVAVKAALSATNSQNETALSGTYPAANKYLLEGGRRRRAASKKASKAKAPKKASKAAKKRTKRSSKK